jgi:pimeloyl-ACP methyl ester carboxylesterase
MHVRELGDGPRVILVHGSVNGAETWSAQEPLAARWRLVIPDRPGFGKSPADGRPDFEREAGPIAELLGDEAHLVGLSYGGVISLLAAAIRPEAVRSLTVIEPPCFRVATGDPAADALVARLTEHWEHGPRQDPAAFLRRFLALVGVRGDFASPLPAWLERGARLLPDERGPWEAEIPVGQLEAAPFPKLVVSGGHNPGFDAVCNALAVGLGAQLVTIAGAGHGVPRTGEPFNATLEAFLSRAP